MMKNVSPHKHTLLPAFSLIELSIVIIILGFLIAGIMSGANMIKVARVNNILAEHRKIKIASNAFLLGRNRLAGDTNRDDMIEYGTMVEGTSVDESIYFWRELSEEKLMESMRYSPPDLSSNNNIVVGTTIPSSKYDKKAGWHAMYIDIDNNNSNISGNALILSGFSNSSLLPLIDSKTAQSIDIKMDDGRPLSGIVYANKNKSDINNICYTSSTEYNIESTDNKNNRCSIIFGEKSVPDTLVSIEDSVGGEGIGVVDVEELMPEPSGVQVFNYTGAPQEFIVPDRVRKVKIEVWGASGGNGPKSGTVGKGGKSGYSYGTLAVAPGKKLYIYAGQAGVVCGATPTFNGGGSAGQKDNDGSGGGATDVRNISGAWNDVSSIESRIIVAGGGGGGSSGGAVENGGNGGGGNANGGDGTPSTYKGKGGGSSGCAIHPAVDTQDTAGGGYYNGCKPSRQGYGGGGGGSGYIGGVTDGGGASGVRTGDGAAKTCWGDRIGECDGTQP